MTFTDVLKTADTVVVEFWNLDAQSPEVVVVKKKSDTFLGGMDFIHTEINCLWDDTAINRETLLKKGNIWITIPEDQMIDACRIMVPEFLEIMRRHHDML